MPHVISATRCSPCFVFLYSSSSPLLLFLFFFFNDTATTEIYTLSLHDALPICRSRRWLPRPADRKHPRSGAAYRPTQDRDRKSTRLNSSHMSISYAVFCLKKKKKKKNKKLNTKTNQSQVILYTV